jgi:WD40 repeat protein
MFSSSADGTICCWSTREFECSFQIKSNSGITALCYSDNVLCSADASNVAKIWNASSGDCLKEINVGRQIGGLCCSAGTLFVSVSRQICIPFSLNTYTAEQQLTLATPADDDSSLTHLCSYGSIVTALACDRVVALTAGGHMEQLYLDRIPVTCHDTADGFIAISHAQKNSVCVFHLQPVLAELTSQLQLPQSQYLENVRSANAKIASTNKSLDLQVTPTGSSRICSVVNVSGMFYIGHADGCLQCFQTFSSGVAKRLFSCQAHEDIVACSAILQLKAADTIATGSGDGSLKLWGQSDGQLLGEIEIGVGVCSICIHQGSVIIGLEDGTLLHVDVDMKFRLKVVGELRGHVSIAAACDALELVEIANMH